MCRMNLTEMYFSYQKEQPNLHGNAFTRYNCSGQWNEAQLSRDTVFNNLSQAGAMFMLVV